MRAVVSQRLHGMRARKRRAWLANTATRVAVRTVPTLVTRVALGAASAGRLTVTLILLALPVLPAGRTVIARPVAVLVGLLLLVAAAVGRATGALVPLALRILPAEPRIVAGEPVASRAELVLIEAAAMGRTAIALFMLGTPSRGSTTKVSFALALTVVQLM